MTPLGSHRDFLHLMKDFNVQVPAHQLMKWRLLFPNVGTLDGFPHLGSVMICATNGIEALYHIDESGSLWKGHLAMFRGPIAKVYVFEEDWDYERNRRRVNVYRRHDGSYAIIPQNSFMSAYWELHPRLTKNERECYQALGECRMSVYDFDAALRMLNESTAQAPAQGRGTKPRVQSARSRLLANL